MYEVIKMAKDDLIKLESCMKNDFEAVHNAIEQVKKHLSDYVSSDRVLKGDEIVGWYGEIIVQELCGGKVITDDTKDYDVINEVSGERYSVKTRKGFGSGWRVTSLIPSNEINDEAPTHLLFVHLDDEYRVISVWSYPWAEIVKAGRLRIKKVKGVERGYTFTVSKPNDTKYLIYGTGE